MKLISYWQNSAGERVRIALNLKGTAYEYTSVEKIGKEEYLRLNPQGLLPALVTDDDKIIAQSTAILQYIDEVCSGPSLLPDDPVVRGQSRAFAGLITSELHAINTKRVRKYLGDRANDWVHHWHKIGLSALEETLQNRAKPTAYCFTDRPGWADLHLVPQLANARRFGVDLTPFPLLTQVEERCNKLAAFTEAKPEKQPDFPGK